MPGAWKSGGSPGGPSGLLDRNVPEREPALELRLDGQLGTDLSLESQLPLGVALVVACRHERIEQPALVVVDPVPPRTTGLLEGEDRAQDALAVTAGLQGARDRVDPHDQVLEVGVAEDHPPVAERVVAGLELAGSVARGGPYHLLHVGHD